MQRRRRAPRLGGLHLSWLAFAAALSLLVGCSGGQPAIPSGLGQFLESFHIPDVSVAPGADQPGPIPNVITGSLTEKLDEDHQDASGGLTNHTVYVVNVKLKQDPAQPPSFGIADYIDDGSSWTHAGQYHNWTVEDLCQASTDITTDYSGSGAFDTSKRYIRASTRDDVDMGWTLDFSATVQDAPGQSTVKNQGVDCHTEHGTDSTSPGIVCLAPWTSPATFKFEVVCDEGGLTVTGTLTGQ